eukprot:TRINITY_DN138_c0_g1_i1.p1 TRINITY_DN138_c0_g1~~TRINITY_DN138_c0_g1_i1.p1  ORF type:complete len:193 (-),score=48.48 TRINITY_DN138_c0_g1_i1:69-647(-)
MKAVVVLALLAVIGVAVARDVTSAQFKCIFPRVTDSKVNSWMGPLNSVMRKQGITSYNQVTMFLAQTGHETDNYNTFVEYTNSAGTNAWCPRYSGGCTYRGRGAMQLTHDYNYRKAGTYFGQNFVSNPALVAQMPWAFETAGYYWGKDWRNIGPVAETGDIERVTRMINGFFFNDTATTEIYTKARQCIPRY